MAEQTIEELEAEIEEKKAQQLKQLQSPFATVGNAAVKRGPGRPPKAELTYEDGEEAHQQRMQQIKRLPDNATEEESREHFNKELYSVLPDIAANLKWDVKFGGSKERSEAGTKVMRALGLESKDVGNIGKGGQIVINMNGPANTLDLPLLRPVMKTVETLLPADVAVKKEDK
jgi:hypothetical protein